MASKYVEFVGWRTITFFSPPRPLEPFVWVVNSLGHRMKNNRLSAVFGNPVSTSIVSRVTDVAAEVITPRVIYSTSHSVGRVASTDSFVVNSFVAAYSVLFSVDLFFLHTTLDLFFRNTLYIRLYVLYTNARSKYHAACEDLREDLYRLLNWSNLKLTYLK